MGYNSTIVVMNDALHAIAEDKDFGRKLQRAITIFGRNIHSDVSAVSERGSTYSNAATVIDCQHADVTQVIAVGWNNGKVLDRTCINYHDNSMSTDEKVLRHLAEKLGFYVAKKPQPKKTQEELDKLLNW